MNMNKKIVKKVMAGSMAVMMAAGLAGTYTYHNEAAIVRAAQEKEPDTKKLTKIAENVLADQTSETEGTSSKEESVYVKTDASGNVTKTTVTEWLKNPQKGTVEDVSQLKDIRNVKGEETFSKNDGDNLSWKSEGEDIYYQGTIDKELPVDVKVSYKLNGKSITPEELKGKSGKVEMRFDYINKSKEVVNVDGKDTQMYTPFTMVTAMMLATDEYKNVSVENGKLVSDGDRNIVVGIAFPGMQENLNLQDIDLDIPESVTVTADVKNASVGPTVTLASADILSEFNLDDIDSFDDLDGSIAQLKDATGKLVDGSADAADGARTLADGAGLLAENTGLLADGAGTLSKGVNTLNDKSGELISGVNTLAEGVGAYTYGVEGLYQGSLGLEEGAAQVKNGAASLNEGVKIAKANADQLANAAGQVQAGVNQVGAVLGNVSGALGNITAESLLGSVEVDVNVTGGAAVLSEEQITDIVNSRFPEADEATKAMVRSAIAEALKESTVTADATTQKSLNANGQALVGAVSQAKAGVDGARTTLTDTAGSPLAQGIAGVADGTGQLAASLGMGDGTAMTIGNGAASLADGTDTLLEGAMKLKTGAEQLYNNSAPLMAGITSLKDGGSQLVGGVEQLTKGAGELADGSQALAEGTQELAGGSQTLADGNQTLADGMAEYKKSAIDELTALFDGDISKVTSRIDAMSTMAKNYRSFAGIKDGISGTTKFIIETSGIDD